MSALRTYILLFGLCIALSASAQRRITPEEYIERYKNLAIEDQDIYGIPASITMAQALLESDCGNSRLATEANNHFGIKCKRDWTGETISHDDDAPGECFRKYPSVEASFRDHSEFLDKSARYQDLFTLDIFDYKGWARGLKAAGYATNPKYAELLINLIEDYRLYELDGLSPGEAAETDIPIEEPAPVEVVEVVPAEKIDVDNYVVSVRTIGDHAIYFNNGSEFILAKAGETFESLAARTGISAKKLRKFNDMAPGTQPEEGDQVYIRSKASRSQNGRLIHIVKEGDTMHSIAQQYGIKLKKLAKINRRDVSSQLSVGQQIRLM